MIQSLTCLAILPLLGACACAYFIGRIDGTRAERCRRDSLGARVLSKEIRSRTIPS